MIDWWLLRFNRVVCVKRYVHHLPPRVEEHHRRECWALYVDPTYTSHLFSPLIDV